MQPQIVGCQMNQFFTRESKMSDIWHKAGFHEAIDDKLKVSKDGKWVYWTVYGWNIAGEDVHDIGCEWAYLDDLLACEQKLDRTSKALDIAVDELEILAEYFECNGDVARERLIRLKLKQINQKKEK